MSDHSDQDDAYDDDPDDEHDAEGDEYDAPGSPGTQLATFAPNPSAEERGWVMGKKDAVQYRRWQAQRRLSSVERQVKVLKMYHKGFAAEDIAEELGMTPGGIKSIITYSLKRSVLHAGAEKERESQLHLTDAVLHRLAERIFPDADPDGTVPLVDLRAIDALDKVLKRRAALTGSDMPSKIAVTGDITHHSGDEAVDRVNQYANLIDQIKEHGYGSGRVEDRPVIDVVEIVDTDRDAIDPPLPVTPWGDDPEPDDGSNMVPLSDRAPLVAKAPRSEGLATLRAVPVVEKTEATP